MMHEFMINIVCPFMGTMGYAVLFNVPRRFYLSCGMTGTAGWLVFKASRDTLPAAVASFLGALVVVLISRMLTVKMKCPITIFLVSGIISTGCRERHILYGLLPCNQPAGAGRLQKGLEFGEDRVWHRAWNRIHRIHSKRSISNQVLEAKKA